MLPILHYGIIYARNSALKWEGMIPGFTTGDRYPHFPGFDAYAVLFDDLVQVHEN